MKLLLLALALASTAACAQPLALPAPPKARLEQRIGAQLPLDVVLTDDTGSPRTLADVVDGSRPVLLVPGYYRCAQLCGLVMHGLLDALQASGVPRSRWRIVGIGIDPRETPHDAHTRLEMDRAYAKLLAAAQVSPGALDLHLFTLAPAQLARVATAIGDHFQAAGDGIAHPATVVLLTPRGDIARYFNGLGIDAGEMRVALADAAGDRLGSVSSRLALLCAHFDPQVGRLNGTVMDGIRAMSALIVLALAGWCWRRRGAGGRR